MKKSRLSVLATGLAVAALALAGCGGSGDSGTGSESGGGTAAEDTKTDDATGTEGGDKPYIAIVSKGFQHQFWQAVKQGADAAAEEFNVQVTFEGPDDETKVQQQIDMLQTALDKHPAALGFAALDSQAAAPQLEQAKSENIPVIAFDSGVESDIPLTTAATDNLAAAAEAAKQMADAIGHKGKVAMVVHDQTSKTGTERRDGFVQYMEENEPDIEIVDIQYGDGDQAKSADITKTILSSNPDLAGIYGSNEGSAIGVVKGVEESGLEPGSLVVIGFDSGKAQIDAIKSGLMLGAITQNPVGMGYETVKAAVEAIEGKELPKTIDTGFFWYTKDNIDDDEIQAVLYE